MDPFSGAGVSGLQSGIVLAVILLAVFFAERLGGSGQLAQRIFQVALGLALTFLVISATTAFDPSPAPPEELQGALFDEILFEGNEDEALQLVQDTGREAAQNAIEVRTIHTGLGLIFIVGGLALMTRLRSLPPGLMLGGLLLLLFGSPPQQGGLAGFTDVFSLIFGTLLPGAGSSVPGQARDIAHFAVLLAGTAALLALGYWRWERSEATAEPTTAP